MAIEKSTEAIYDIIHGAAVEARVRVSDDTYGEYFEIDGLDGRTPVRLSWDLLDDFITLLTELRDADYE